MLVIVVVVVFSECEVQLIQIVLVLVHQISGVDARRVDRGRRRRLAGGRDHRGGPDLGKVLLADHRYVLALVRLLRVDLKKNTMT